MITKAFFSLSLLSNAHPFTERDSHVQDFQTNGDFTAAVSMNDGKRTVAIHLKQTRNCIWKSATRMLENVRSY